MNKGAERVIQSNTGDPIIANNIVSLIIGSQGLSDNDYYFQAARSVVDNLVPRMEPPTRFSGNINHRFDLVDGSCNLRIRKQLFGGRIVLTMQRPYKRTPEHPQPPKVKIVFTEDPNRSLKEVVHYRYRYEEPGMKNGEDESRTPTVLWSAPKKLVV